MCDFFILPERQKRNKVESKSENGYLQVLFIHSHGEWGCSLLYFFKIYV